MTKSASSRFCRCVLLCVLVASALCAAWCVAASANDNGPTAAALSTSADSSSSDGRCASMNDCYTDAQTNYIRNVFSALRSSLQNTGWSASSNVCTFPHVACWPSGVVVNFTGVGLVGTLPPLKEVSVADLPATPITAMIFDNNSGITGTLSSNFGYMAQMKTFSATETGLDGTLPETWSAMTGLQVLRLSNTPVTGTLPASWSALIHLTTVALDNTSLSGTLPAEWSTMTSLTSFTAAGTEVNGTLPETWSAMAALQVLSVNDTQVDGTLPASWSSLKAMRSIFIANTTVSGTLPPEWGNLTSLVAFDAAETELNGTLPTSWSTMTALQVLRLTGAPVNGTIPESWSAMRSLKTVSLAGTNITGCLPASWTDKLGLTMTGVGLPETAACNTASKHKSKMPWWAILILVLGIVLVAAAITLAILWWKSKLPCKLLNRKKYCHTGYRLIRMRRNNNRRPIFFGAAEFSAAELAEGRITRDIRRKFRRLREWQERRGIAPPGASAVPGSAPLPASARATTSATSAPTLTDEAVNTQAAPSLLQGGFQRGLIANDDETEDPPAFDVQDERDQQSESGSVEVDTRDAESGPPQSTLRVRGPYLVRDYTLSRQEQDTLETLSSSNDTAFRNPLQPMSELSQERDVASDYDSRTRVQHGCLKRTANEQQRLARRQPLDAASQHEYSLLQDPHTAPQIYGPFLDIDSTELSI